MLHEDSRVRLKGSTLIGAIVDFDLESDHCIVDPDLSVLSERPADPFEVDLSEIEELVEAGNQGRREICNEFDLVRFEARVEIRLDMYYQLVIERTDEGYWVKVARLLDQEGNKELLLEEEDADRFRERFSKMGTYRWIDLFEPKGYHVLDGYSWDLEVYSGSHYYTCTGNNVTPQELLDFVDFIASLGLPRIDVFD